jgi:plastocyanin
MLAAATAADSDKAGAATAAVKIDNFSFGPQTLTVPVDKTVTWTNRDDIPHTIVSTDGVFTSNVRDTDETFSYSFTKAGTYTCVCSVHPKRGKSWCSERNFGSNAVALAAPSKASTDDLLSRGQSLGEVLHK